MAIEEDKTTGNWKERGVCMGDTKTCSFPGLINHHHKFIISFAEDEAGELYFLATAYPSAMSPFGTVFKFMDPSRRAPPGKCKQKPLPVKVRGKKLPFVPRELTVMDTNEKPTRPPPRKFKLTTKPPVTSSQVKPTSAASVTTTSAAVKPKWKSSDKKVRKKNKLKPWRKNKVLNKQAANAQIKKITLRQKSKEQSKKTTVIKPVGDKVKPKTNQTATADLKGNALQTPNSLKRNTIHTRKIPPKKGAEHQIRHEKNSIKLKQSAKEYHAFMNKTKTNLKVKRNRTMQNKLQLKSKRAKDAKVL